MQRTHSVEEPDAQPSMRAPVLMPALVEGAFDYLVPVGTPEGRLVEATLAGRTLVGAVWKDMTGADAQGPVASKEGMRSASEPRSGGGLGAMPPSGNNYSPGLK